MRIRSRRKSFRTAPLRPFEVRDERLEPLSHYSYYKKIRKDSIHRLRLTLKKHQKKSFAQSMHYLFYKKLTKERWNMVL